MNIGKYLPKKLFKPKPPTAAQVLQSQSEMVSGFLNTQLNKPVIAVTGQHTALTVGFMIGVSHVGRASMPCPIVSDYLTLETKLVLGRVWPYSAYILRTLYKLTPEERWVFINTVDSFPRMEIPLVGDAPERDEPSYEQCLITLKDNKFFEHASKVQA